MDTRDLVLDNYTKGELEAFRDGMRPRGVEDLVLYQLVVCKLRLKYYRGKKMKLDGDVRGVLEGLRGGGK